jgi:sulfur relay (sulfurtransferase) complex TusBCD TusD component (DsrE family)
MDARGISDAELAEAAKRGSLSQLTDWTVWAEKTLVF